MSIGVDQYTEWVEIMCCVGNESVDINRAQGKYRLGLIRLEYSLPSYELTISGVVCVMCYEKRMPTPEGVGWWLVGWQIELCQFNRMIPLELKEG